MLQSMTGFAALKGSLGAHSWTWDIRSVNAKGLDLRLRMPDWIEGLEPAVRGALGKSMSRGSVSLGLRVQREESEGTLMLNRAQLSNVLAALHEAETLAAEQGIALSASRSADILNVRGVLETATDQDDSNPLREALMAQLPD